MWLILLRSIPVPNRTVYYSTCTSLYSLSLHPYHLYGLFQYTHYMYGLSLVLLTEYLYVPIVHSLTGTSY